MKTKKVIIVRESAFSSIVSDIFSIGILLSALLFNFHFLGNAVVLQILACIMFLCFLSKSTTYTTMKPQDALKYLYDSLKKDEEK